MPSKFTPEERHQRRLVIQRRAYAKRRLKALAETPEQREARLSKCRASKLEWYRSHKEHARRYYQANQKTILERERSRAANRTEEEKEAMRLRTKTWYAKNRDVVLRKNLEYQSRNRAAANRRSKAFALRHPERVLANEMRYRARKFNADVGETKAIAAWMKAMRQLKSFTCYHCAESKPRKELHFDHVIPLAKGGKHSLGNLAAACAECNFSKNDKLPHEWPKLKQRSLSL